ncbi:MAG: histidine phosphatase family protein [bacterium]
MKIYLIRHGQTTGDVEDRYGGDYDDRLSDLGKKQANELAEKLAGLNVDVQPRGLNMKIISSPKIRAKETAEIISKKIGAGVEIADGFRERNRYGILTGMTKTEAKEKYPELAEEVKDLHATITSAEDYESFRERIHTALAEIVSRNNNAIAIVTHGGPMKLIFEDVFNAKKIDIDDCGFAEIENDNGVLKVIKLNGIKIE